MTSHALIRGYRRHGKDTFASALSRGNLEGYQIFSTSPYFNDYRIRRFLDAKIDHFAEPLKREVVFEDIAGFVFDNLEIFKDGVTITLPKTVREYLIERAFRKRQEDPYVYARIITERNWCNNAIVPDFRYPEELKCGDNEIEKIIFHVWHSETPEPDMSVQSEHQLDQVIPHFVVLRKFDTPERDQLERERYLEYAKSKNLTVSI